MLGAPPTYCGVTTGNVGQGLLGYRDDLGPGMATIEMTEKGPDICQALVVFSYRRPRFQLLWADQQA
jgi:hypothetical protein